MRCLALLIALCLVTGHAQAQVDSLRKSVFSLGLMGHGGYLLKHSQSLAPLKESYPWGFQADLGWQLVTEKAYRFCSCYPRLGFSVNYFNFDNGAVLGNAYYLLGYIEPVFFLPRRFNLSFRLALLGVSFQDRPFHETENPLNLAYSTYVAFPLAIELGLNYRPSDRLNLRLSFNYNHISNGGIKDPNKGLNFPTVSLGGHYTFRPVRFTLKGRMRRPPPEKKNRWEIEFSNAFKNAYPAEKAQYWVFGISTSYSRWFHRSSAAAMGFHWEMDNARRMRSVREGLGVDHNRLSLTVGHEFWLGRVQFGQYVGFYLYDRMPTNGIWYHRHKLSVQITEFMFMAVSLKAHRQVADYLDLRLGFNIGARDKAKTQGTQGKAK